MERLQLHASISRQKWCSIGQSPHLMAAILHIVSAEYLCWDIQLSLGPVLGFQFCSHLLDPPSSAPGQDTLLSFLSQLPLPAGQGELSFAKVTSGAQQANRCDKDTDHLGNMAKHKRLWLTLQGNTLPRGTGKRPEQITQPWGISISTDTDRLHSRVLPGCP